MRSAEPWDNIWTLSAERQDGLAWKPLLSISRALKGLTGGGVSHTQRHEVGDGGLAFGEVGEAAGGQLLGGLSGWQLVEGQVVLLLEQLPGSRSEPWRRSRKAVRRRFIRH